MRKRVWVSAMGAGMALAAATPVWAQTAPAPAAPRVSLAGGYVFARDLRTGTMPAVSYEIGWAATGTVRLGGTRLSIVGNVDASAHTTTFQERQALFGVAGGARFDAARWHGLTLYAQGVAGLERFSEPGYAVWGAMIQPGAGVDVRLSSRLFARAQADYRLSFEEGDTFHALRVVIGAGVAWR